MITLKLILTLLLSYLLATTIMPMMRKLATWVDLTDKPNTSRKVHTQPVPLVGGIVIAITSILTMMMALDFDLYMHFGIYPVMVGGSILLVTGIIDDKVEISPFKKLLIQFCCAYFIVEKGFVLDHFLDQLHLYMLPMSIKKIITITFIVAVVNAYNLMDGIDGLAGVLFSLAFVWIGLASIVMQQWALCLLCVSISGGLWAFLKYNMNDNYKVFLGDSGSLFLSFILVSFSIYVMDMTTSMYHNTMASGIVALIALPLIDALRVFAGRIKKGKSPFFADKSHIHHVFLGIYKIHNKVSVTILRLSVLIMAGALVMAYYFSITAVIFYVMLVFALLMYVVSMIDGMYNHRQILATQERRN